MAKKDDYSFLRNLLPPTDPALMLGGDSGDATMSAAQAPQQQAPQEEQPGQPNHAKRALASILGQLALGGGNGLLSVMAPKLFDANQQQQQQQRQFEQQLQLHRMITPYEQAQLGQQQQSHTDAQRQQQFENMRQLASGIASGGMQNAPGPGPGVLSANGINATPVEGGDLKAQQQLRDENNRKWLLEQTQQGTIMPAHKGEDGAQEIGGSYWKIKPARTVNIPKELQDMFGTEPINLSKENNPVIEKLFDENMKERNKVHVDPSGYFKQIDTLFPLNDPASAKLNLPYKQQLQTLLNSGDTKGADSLLTRLTDGAREWDLKYGDKTMNAEARLSGLRKSAEDKAAYQDARAQLWPSMEGMYKQVKRGTVSYGDLVGRMDSMGKRVFDEYLSQNGDSLPVALSGSSMNQLNALEPVLDSLKKLKLSIGQYKDNKAPLLMLAPRVKYSLGIGDDQGGLISTGEMDRLRGASQSLKGIRSGLDVLEKAQIHTPNFWKDSGKLMNDKVDNMIEYLQNNVDSVYKYGSKQGVVGAGSRAQPGKDEKPPEAEPKYIVVDGKAQLNPKYKGQ